MEFSVKMLLFIALFFLCLDIGYCSVFINEIMYNPSGNDNDFEYIELYGEGDNISGYYFEGIEFIFPKNSSIIEYVIIANTLNESGEDNDFIDRYNNMSRVFEFKGSLLNSGETIILRDDKDKIIDIVTYYDWSSENHSIERIDMEDYSSDPDNWAESVNGGTPGKENSVTEKEGCDWQLEIVMNESISEKPKWQIRAEKKKGEGKANMTIQHWIEDSLGRRVKNYSDIVAENILTRKTSSKYGPSLKGGEGYYIKANISKINCKEIELLNNFVSKLIFVRGEDSYLEKESRFDILDVSPEEIEFGDIIKVKINLYRGETSKYAIYIYIENEDDEKVSEKSTMHLKSKFTNYSIILPVQIKPNCDNKYEEGDHFVIIEGLDEIVEEKIEIEGINTKLCKETEDEKIEKITKGKFGYEIVDIPLNIQLNESFDVKVKTINEDDEKVVFDIWSYIYRGGKRYSEEYVNKRHLSVDTGSEKEIILKNIMLEGEEGDYKFKVKLLKEGRLTTDDEIKDIHLIVPEEISIKEETGILLTSVNIDSEKEQEERKEKEVEKEIRTIFRDSDVIYESDTFFIKKMIPVFMVILLILSIVFSLTIFRKTEKD
jgi:hypothetical protein